MGYWHLAGTIDVGKRTSGSNSNWCDSGTDCETTSRTTQWDRELNLVPWLIDGPVARPEAGWTPAAGYKSCDEGGTGMKRRGRPFNYNPECAERRAVFRERLREVEIVSADGAPPLMELVDCLVLSSSSFGVDAQQPVAVDPWPSSPWPQEKSLKSVRGSPMAM